MAGQRPVIMTPRMFDEQSLATMIEPLTVRVDRLHGTRRSPIPLWENSTGSSTTGWNKDEVRGMESHLATSWSGGGQYEITVVDSTPDQPRKLTWSPYFATQDFPEMIPPPLRDGSIAAEASPSSFSAMQPQPQQFNTQFGVIGTRMPPTSFTPFTPPSMPAQPAIGTQHYNVWREEVARREQEAELKATRAALEQRDREAREEKHRAEIERERTANNEKFSRLEQSIIGLATSLKEAATPKVTGPSPELLAMQAQLAEMKEQARRSDEEAKAARREQEADRRESQLRDMIRQQGEAAQKQLEAMQRQIEQQATQFQTTITTLMAEQRTAAAANQSNPMLQFMQENARITAQMFGDMARENRGAIDGIKAFMMNPAELMRLARESQDGVERAVSRTMDSTNKVVEMQQRVLENALQMQPQSSGVVDVIREGISSAKEGFERFVSAKSKESVGHAQAQARVIEAQARAYEAQMRGPSMPPPYVEQAGLNGVEFQPPPPPEGAPTAAEVSTQPEAVPTAPKRVERMWGRTDEEWFGSALPHVEQLRGGVAQFLAACEMHFMQGTKPQGDLPGVSPAAAAHFINLAIGEATSSRTPVPALTDLLLRGQLPEFVTVLLPAANDEFRAALVAVLRGASVPSQGNEDDDDDDNDEDDRDDEDDEAEVETPAQVEVLPALPAPAQSRRNGRRAAS